MPARNRSRHLKKTSSASILRRFLLFTFLALFTGVLWKIYLSWQNQVFVPGTRLTVVVAQENPTLYSYNPSSRELTIIVIPKNTQVEAAGGYGSWPIGSLWNLGKQEGQKGELLRVSVMKAFGIPVDGWVGPDGEDLFKDETLALPIKVFKAISTGSLKTDLTFFDRLNLLSIGAVSFSRRSNLDLEAKGVLEKKRLPDGVEGFIIIPERGKIVFEELRDSALLNEKKTAFVFNATGKAGLAGQVVQVVQTLGIRVIGAGKGEEEIEDCQIRAKGKNLGSISAKKLSQVFGCRLTTGGFTESSSDIEILLGEGFAKRF